MDCALMVGKGCKLCVFLISGTKMSISGLRHNFGRNASSLSLIDSTPPSEIQVSWDRLYAGCPTSMAAGSSA